MTPENGGYAWAAYLIVIAMYAGYALSIWVRGRHARAGRDDA